MKEKIFTDAGRLVEILEDLRSGDRKVVLANGCFDIIPVSYTHLRAHET